MSSAHQLPRRQEAAVSNEEHGFIPLTWPGELLAISRSPKAHNQALAKAPLTFVTFW